MSSQPPAPNPNSSTSTPIALSQPPPAKTSIDLPSTSLIADNVHIRGHNLITFGRHTLVHPRAYFYSGHAPINIGSHTTIFPKATIGSPMPSSTSTSTSTTDQSLPRPPISTAPTSSSSFSTPVPTPTTIGSHVQIHPHTLISHSTTIHDYAVIESHCILLPGASVGAHSKICSGVTISSSVPEWIVAYGNGDMRRRRKPLASTSDNVNGDGDSDSTDKSNDGDAKLSLSPDPNFDGGGTAETATDQPIAAHPPNSNSTPLHPLWHLPESQRIQNQSLENAAAASILRSHMRPSHITGHSSRRPAAQQRELTGGSGGNGVGVGGGEEKAVRSV